jgi:hypothetical protein
VEPVDEKNRLSPVTFYVFAQFVAGNLGHRDIRDDHIGRSVGKAQKRHPPVANGDYLMTFIPKNPLTHPLRVRAVVGEQNATHCFGCPVEGESG